MGYILLEFDSDAYGEADFARNAEERHSVPGVGICGEGIPLSLFPRTQNCGISSTMEVEYVVTAGDVKETPYVTGILTFLMPSLGSESLEVFEDNM